MGTRDIFSGSDTGPIQGRDFFDQYAMHMTALYRAATFPLTGATGANDVTATLDPPLGAAGLVDGMRFGISWPAANTGGMTLSIDGATPVPVLDAEGAALVPGAVSAGLRSTLEYVGGAFLVQSPLLAGADAGSGSYFWKFEVSGTFVKPTALPDDAPMRVQLWGAGGGGRNSAPATGGGGGEYKEAVFRCADVPTSVAILVGSGGMPLSAGGDTAFGALLTAEGGQSVSGGFRGGGFAGGAEEDGIGMDDTIPRNVDAKSIWAGGGGASGSSKPGGHAVYGGGGGADGAPGVSVFGGNGGTDGVAGSAPGGGGGIDAPGARGEVRIWI